MVSFEEQVLDLVNAERAALGLNPLDLNPLLGAAATGYAWAMANGDFFGHTGLDGSTSDDRAAAAGYGGSAGENLAAGFATPADAMAAWMASPGHRANILHPDYKSMGVGYALLFPDTGENNFFHYWTQEFGLEPPPNDKIPNSVDLIDNDEGGHTITLDDTSEFDASLGTVGIDEVRSTANINPLPSTIENVTLLGTENRNAFGNGLDNNLTGNEGLNRLHGRAGADHLQGAGGKDSLQGNAGNDTVAGGLGDDEVRGGGGDDELRGSRGTDSLIGGRGNDSLNGGTGDDTLEGREGADHFIFDQPGAGVATGHDVITDFALGEDLLVIASQINDLLLSSPAEALARLTQDDAGNAVLDLGEDGSITLLGVAAATLSEGDIFII